MTKNDRANFGSKLGVILASAGSAVGLGNIWRFPYETGNHGGAAFILIYLGCIYGANLLLLSDIISKILKYPYESPVGIVTAFMGAVFYIILANKEMKRGGVSEK